MSKAALKQSLQLVVDRDPINEAIVVYTGFGKSAFPRARGGDLVTQFGAEPATELKARILALYDELAQPVPEPEKLIPDPGSGTPVAPLPMSPAT